MLPRISDFAPDRNLVGAASAYRAILSWLRSQHRVQLEGAVNHLLTAGMEIYVIENSNARGYREEGYKKRKCRECYES